MNKQKLKVLIACEFSGCVRDSFLAKGHDAMSCDLLPTENPGPHFQGDVREILNDGWDLMIAHPPCTYLTVSANKWYYHPEDKHLPTLERRPHPSYPNRRQDRLEAIEFVKMLLEANIPKIAIENPIGVLSSLLRKPDQIIQPWMFGHMEQKATCLWLKGLPLLVPTNNVKDEMMKLSNSERQRLHYLPPGPDRWKERSKTFLGISEAMATQWG